MNKEQLKKIAEDTIKIQETGNYKLSDKTVDIKKDINKCIKETKLYKDNIIIDNIKKPEVRCKYEFIKETTLSAAKRILDLKGDVCILNFASAKHPGGGFQKGTMAQEESIAYVSGLYTSLNKYYDDFYKFHLNHLTPFYSDRIIYSPSVPVFKDETYQLLEKPYFINIITSPAVNAGVIKSYNKPKETEKIIPAMEKRIRKIIQTAIINGEKNLILGAFGCGVFKNELTDVAKIFKKILVIEKYQEYFETIVFAIYDRTGDAAVSTFKNHFMY